MDTIAVLDFGSQYAQLIARRVREAHVYCELFPWNEAQEKVLALDPRGFILSGGPASVYEREAPFIPTYILESQLPILGICYGMQAITFALGGSVVPSAKREYGLAEVETTLANQLLPDGKRSVRLSPITPTECTGNNTANACAVPSSSSMRNNPAAPSSLVNIASAWRKWSRR